MSLSLLVEDWRQAKQSKALAFEPNPKTWCELHRPYWAYFSSITMSTLKREPLTDHLDVIAGAGDKMVGFLSFKCRNSLGLLTTNGL